MKIEFFVGIPTATIQLTDFPYTSGVVQILSPIGTVVYENTDYGLPDFTNPSGYVTKDLPVSPTNGQTMEGIYTVKITEDTGGHPSTTYLPKLQINPYTCDIRYFQDCSAATTLLNYTSNIPVDATVVSTIWQIADPNGTISNYYTPSVVLNPIISGTYQINLTIVFYVVETQGSADVSVKYRTFCSTNYVNTCGNAQSILCETMYCCLKTALYEFLNSPTTANLYGLVAKTAAAVLMQLAITCNKQTDAQEILNKLNSSQYNCPPCGCGCKD